MNDVDLSQAKADERSLATELSVLKAKFGHLGQDLMKIFQVRRGMGAWRALGACPEPPRCTASDELLQYSSGSGAHNARIRVAAAVGLARPQTVRWHGADIAPRTVLSQGFDKDGTGRGSKQEVLGACASLGLVLTAKEYAGLAAQCGAEPDGQVQFSQFCEVLSMKE